jgi:hypothetical protein
MVNPLSVSTRGTIIALAAAAMGLSAGATSVRAAYTHVNVADSGGPLGTQLLDYALNDSGQVTFNNFRDDSQYGVYRWTGSGAPQLVAETSANIPGWATIFVSPTINNSGQIAFFGVRSNSTTDHRGGIFRADPPSGVGPINPIATEDATQNTTGFAIGTDINDNGVVAYQRRTSGVSRSIVTGNGTAEQTIFTAADGDILGWWSINNGGNVAIAGTVSGAKTLLRNSNNVTPGNFTDFRSPVIQDDGDIYFAGTRTDSSAGVYKLVGTSTLTTIVDTVGDGFTGGFARSSANGDGDIAFMATPTSGGGGIYFLADGLTTSQAERVIGVGDALFGSTVTSILLAPRGLNDTDQVAYSYGLANGVRGIGVASVPEPASLAVVSLGAVSLMRRNRRGLSH